MEEETTMATPFLRGIREDTDWLGYLEGVPSFAWLHGSDQRLRDPLVTCPDLSLWYIDIMAASVNLGLCVCVCVCEGGG